MASYDPRKVPPHIGHYLTGFADGKGSFDVSFRKRKDGPRPWIISLCFKVTQQDKVILALFKRHLKCGRLRSRADETCYYYEVDNLNAIREHVIPFFNRYGFLSAAKKREFSTFKTLADMLVSGDQLTEAGIRRVLKLRKEINDGECGRRRYSDEEILEALRAGESSETIRQAAPEEGR